VSDADEMQNLLTYANYKKVGDALGVTKTTVSNWAHGINVSPHRLLQVRDLLRPETAREAAPIEGRLLASHLALERKLRITPVELAAAEAEAMVLIAHLLGGNGTQPRRSDDGGAGGAGAPI